VCYPDHDADFEIFCSRIREKYIVKLFTLPLLKSAVERASADTGMGRDPGRLNSAGNLNFAAMRNGISTSRHQ
jgi:hypothetical protein